jgi:hypothetical protein
MRTSSKHNWTFSTAAAALAAASLLLACCAGQRKAPDPRSLPYKQASAYSADIGASLARSVPERIGEAPPALLDYLRRMDRNSSYAAYVPTEAERALFAEYYATLPQAFKAAMDSRLLGVYFIENFEGGGMSDYVFRGDGSMLTTLILNRQVLESSLQDWIQYRDGSPYFDDGHGVELRSRVEGGGAYKGLIQTLTHEAAHLYDYVEHATPYVEPHLASPSDGPSSKDFTRGAWAGYSRPEPAFSIPRLAETAAYGLGKRLPISVAAEQYAALAKTPYASLYGAGSWAEDFAESSAWTWLDERLGIAYSVSVLRGGTEIARFAPGLGPASDARKASLRVILGL